MTQVKFSFDSITKNKIVDGLVVTIIAAVCSYILKMVVPSLDIGTYTPLVVLVVTNLCNIVLQWCRGQAVPQV